MKSITMPVSEQFEENENELFNEVKETVAKDENKIQDGPKRQFTVSEMWNRNRHMSSASSRIRRWNLN